MATIRSYTSLEQSKKLAEILPIKSADMTYYACVKDWRGNSIEPKWGKPTTLTKEELALPRSNFQEYEYVPCWSLAALLGVLPSATLDSSNDHYYRLHCVERYTEWYDKPVDACYEIIIKLHDNKLL
jgi:hypothetical protein